MRARVSSVAMVAAFLWLGFPAPTQGQQRGQPAQLPEGAGQEMVQRACTGCHRLGSITNSVGYTRDGWERLFSSMVALPDPEAEIGRASCRERV